jgi:flavin reductase (DIM6/NTAB) family NADH-FMN oxidoreductase RutF
MTQRPVDLFRRLTTGVYVIGTAHAGRTNAFTAAWLTQVSFNPLLLALSINPEGASYPLLRESGVFSVNVLDETQVALAVHFGTVSGRNADKLAGMRWSPGQLGAPVLDAAAAFLECRVTTSTPAGDHVVIIGHVAGGAVHRKDAVPLRYSETGDLDGSAALYPPSF